jgi:hypothetical protein
MDMNIDSSINKDKMLVKTKQLSELSDIYVGGDQNYAHEVLEKL